MTLHLEIRSYPTESAHHQHDFVQLVLPICGHMEIEVDGRGGRIDHACAALVAPGATHAQLAPPHSRFLVLDCAAAALQTYALHSLPQRVHVAIAPATRRLIEYAELIGTAQLAASATHLAPLLLASLAQLPTQPTAGFERLVARVQAHPADHWSNERMAQVAGMSMSQLHQRVHQHLQTTPQAWLAQLRIQHAQRWLGDSSLPIAEIALRSGFSDQAALTRAMHRLCGITPAAWRKGQRQPG
ncbi:helix-turn-helix transcriptional regulator [Pseudomonas sp. MAFF212428]|uniref:Helix-turn-helix transcriptional regulator n=1 Tax=Pseudomonas brassicae TaxID=2708063 RepID=A0A6B3NV12_9PSED|nr:AraC family transcriptional regulator [Pseudomonas brassicae]NER60036.1 helix-turn-helix transcriptional regulator [Pseudomonas brassicae]NER65816.1 helix-turn-helix transcriptional regulator [Pseudomonas brassicae]